ncbi:MULTISPECIES: hypothetical protein [Pseudomonadaceae]|uniref:Lipoprotein n=1 Tax=Pseudomonas denitrificans TaxID=43306 RepID=A0A9X7MXJ6_PSEDE|nr:MULTISPECIES: hypothetical protein [Pseudomonadaceae]MBD9518122.1 hypothetical protein [Pseudomonas sp. PDM22]MBD9684691.1 hypothetical protein [Pseudomonas sp. PDM20]QEY71221.1 hypothetical protein F1C79_05965 [Pseudomonas denitrificans (nom. rej.)]
MGKTTALLMIGALAVLLGGSSCGSHNDHDAPRPPPMEEGQMGYRNIPQQQMQPQVQSIPRR